MMSLYHMLFGENKWAEFLKGYLELGAELYPMGRYRDIYYDSISEVIVLYTRNGGGNREEFQYVFEALKKHPRYKRDYDDDFDNTYAYVEFSIPKEHRPSFKILMGTESPKNVHEKFDALVKKLNAGELDDEAKRALEVGRQIFDDIKKGKKVIKV